MEELIFFNLYIMNIEREKPLEARLAERLDSLQATTAEAAKELSNEGYPEETVAALLSMHEMLNRLVRERKLDDKILEAKFIRNLHDGIRGIYDGLLMGLGHEREEQHRQIAESPTSSLNGAFREALRKVSGGKVGPTETRLASETIV